MKNLLEYILIHIVQYPEDVKIDETQDERGSVFIIHVNPEDVGRVIGKGGAVIQSIRNIGKIRAIKEGIRARITIDDGKDTIDISRPRKGKEAPVDSDTEMNEDATSQLEETQTDSETNYESQEADTDEFSEDSSDSSEE